ncbi:cytochrome c biogenesis protein CcsA [Luteimonas sp. MC1782]|uniref:cytochrome C assembly family protein n=1 Tax=Luteimonas sp. MC1782 TaxID=2760305 RepID=UPI0016006F8E|nr:cytochrome c biogenesis protein CcsA [Luteimonas sp. MC1782]MBB1472388.1 cytochrome c biogenesis protein CcsA [Luteimonas sp. MC1782]
MTSILIAALLYALATALLVRALRRGPSVGRGWLPFAAAAVIAHAVAHAIDWHAAAGVDLHFHAALSLVGLGMAALTTGYGARGRMAALGVVVFPIAMASLLAWASQHGDNAGGARLSLPLRMHAGSALLAYATLAVAAVLAVMLWLQERSLRRREFHGWLRVLPPMVELETLLFRTIGVGFVLLTATLLTGLVFVDDFFAQHLVHKSVLSVLSWLAFGALLVGRWRRGWRGAIAVRWTLAAMVLLVLAFFGSKFVLEMVLGRG